MSTSSCDTAERTPLPIFLGMTECEAQRVMLFAALRAHGGNKLRAARALGINRRTLYRRLEVYAAAALEPLAEGAPFELGAH